jgi:hypothetical protein
MRITSRMSPRFLLAASLGICLSACAVAPAAPVAKSDGFDPQHLDEYHLHRLDGTQNCAKVRLCNEPVTAPATTDIAKLGVTPDYESWPQGAIP